MDKNELVKKMKRGEIGFIDEPEEEKEVWEIFKSIPDGNLEQRKKKLQEVAKATLGKNKRISILVNERDFFELKSKATEAGFSYQSLIGVLIHNYVAGKISLTI